jgi:3-oxoacyl-[acyl-carrier protein] reductase
MVDTGVTLSLPDQVALISGGSRGIGAAAVRLFVRAGARVAFGYERAAAAAAALVAECGPDRCAAFPADLAAPDGPVALVSATLDRFGRLDCLVANHGIWPPADVPVDELPAERWRRTLAVNLDGVFGLIKHGVGAMKRGGRGGRGGRVVVVSSTAGQRGEAFHCDYAASKGAVISMVKGLATELAPDGILVNCVAPGWVDTDMSVPSLADPATRARVLGTIPIGRVGTPDEIAAPILFLCTAHAGFVTGEIFNVNGGAVLVG